MEPDMRDTGGDPDINGIDTATAAFVEMRDSFSTMARAVSSLSGEWKALVIPDYSKTLEKVAMELKANADQLEKWAEKPALKLTPQALSDAIIKAGSAARADDHVALDRAIMALNQTEKNMTGALVSARTAQAQDKRLRRVSINCMTAGMVLWAMLPGMIIRAMPASWHLPERMAARMLGTNAWEGGQRLMVFANPDGWASLAMVGMATQESRETVEACMSTATKLGKPIRCSISVIPATKESK
jgi:Family of unknown function (DUF6118)